MDFEAKLIRHNNKNRIAVWYPNIPALIARFRKLTDAKWSSTLKVWHLPDTSENRERFELPSDKGKGVPFMDKISQIEQFKKHLATKRYSPNTVKTYSDALQTFLFYYNAKDVRDIDNQDVVSFYNDYILEKNLSSSFQNQVVNAIKLYFRTIRETAINVDKIYRPKRDKLLPNVLSKEEIKKILNAHTNIKHKAMLCMIYSCGLRRSELLRLKPNDIDSKRNLVIIRQAKGRKDRIAPLSPAILGILREYYKVHKPLSWLFEGQYPDTVYDERSLGNVLKQALQKTGIKKPVTLHWLRHSYATHLLESGTDLRYIQEILGHKSSRTTEIYTHVSTKSLQNVKSPFDDL
ncbi:tyrosine-type recombinase/integrase [Pedobacter arcticus]|uniref:tyrosine-type recombinase/integrase n=1 Tax=Pedobacter arcticus TaxID=752140 RepID=UPI0002EE2AC6|nr:site-specific integrase [Pedobacter arcticus]